MTRTARLRAFAKLNLGLRVLYRRPDGYHELRTVFQTISLADRLKVAFTRSSKTRIEIAGCPDIADNLVEKAAWMVMEAMRIQADIRFDLKKNIPMGSGLGGGSSDAAAVLLALPVLAGKTLPMERLSALAGRLGSDVAFFLHGGSALGMGRGEELYPLPDRPARKGVVVASNVHSSTAEAYRDLSQQLTAQLTSTELQNKLVSFQQEIWQGGEAVDDNDFQGVVFARYPELKRIKDRLRRLGARPAAMTGSGSAIYGLFAEASQVERAIKSFPHERVFAISLVSRAQYRSAWRRALHPHSQGTQWPPQSLYAR
jgi:4-diphosphocytidyl-2-C-methyl-D-erythritol kinase